MTRPRAATAASTAYTHAQRAARAACCARLRARTCTDLLMYVCARAVCVCARRWDGHRGQRTNRDYAWELVADFKKYHIIGFEAAQANYNSTRGLAAPSFTRAQTKTLSPLLPVAHAPSNPR